MESPLRQRSEIVAPSTEGFPRETPRLHAVTDRPRRQSEAASSIPFGADKAAGWRLDDLVSERRRLQKGSVLVRSGEAFAGLFGIVSGSCKSVVSTASGQEYIASFSIAGEVLGTDAIHTGVHDATITALEASEFCVMPFDRVEALARRNPNFQRTLSALFSGQISRERNAMLMLGTMRAEQRLATFLLDLADRYCARGYSSCEFVLRLTREEIGGHLGVTLETVSRLFSRLHHEGVLGVQGRVVKLLDRDALLKLKRGDNPR